MISTGCAIALILAALDVAAFSVIAFGLYRRWITWRWLVPAVIAGTILGWYCSTVSYGLRENVRAVGFPLPSAIFDTQNNGIVADYVGWVSILSPPINFVLGVGCPHIILAILTVSRARREKNRN